MLILYTQWEEVAKTGRESCGPNTELDRRENEANTALLVEAVKVKSDDATALGSLVVLLQETVVLTPVQGARHNHLQTEKSLETNLDVSLREVEDDGQEEEWEQHFSKTLMKTFLGTDIKSGTRVSKAKYQIKCAEKSLQLCANYYAAEKA